METSTPEYADPARPHVVIIGGGFGGLNAARELKDSPVRVTIVDRWNYHLFQPLLYQVAMAGLSPSEIAYPIRTVLRDQENTHMLLGEVTNIDVGQRTVTLHDGAELHYDSLIVAAGARTNFFGKEATWARHALGMKSIEDALEVRRRVLLAFETAEREPDPEKRKALLTFVVIGGGPTGVELAGALSDLSRTVLSEDFRVIDPAAARVILIEMVDRVLAGGFDEKLSRKAKEQLEELGVEVRLGTVVKDIDANGVLAGDEYLQAGVVLWTAGVMARRLTRKLGVELDRGGRVVVNQDCSVPGHPEVFAIGDCARLIPEGTTSALPGVAQVAIQQGKHASRMIVRTLRGEPREAFHYRDKGMMATIGRSRAVAQAGKLQMSGWIAWMAWLFVHIWFLVGIRNRIAVVFNWFWAYVTYRRGARLITGWRSWDWSGRENNVMLPQYEPWPDAAAAPPAAAPSIREQDGVRVPLATSPRPAQ
ncbi:MAG TPA: NAD(P)/FAD-dependent oxidoreductase [Polyangiaceae bacterium]